MHNHVDHRWIQTLLRKIISVLLIYSIFFSSQANAAVGGWDLKNPVAQGASTAYDATKNAIINGKKYIKESSVKITPTATSVAKVLARGGAGYALSVAVEQLLGSVDWVLDPANNQITYTPKNEALCTTDGKNCPSSAFLWASAGQYFSTAQNACANELKVFKKAFPYMSKSTVRTQIINQRSANCLIDKVYDDGTRAGTNTYAINNVVNPNYLEESEPKSIPLTTVAQKVISNAEGGDVNAQVATTAAAADIVAEAEKDAVKARPIVSQAEANAKTKPADAAEAEKANEAQGEAKPNEANPEATDLSITFPIFCDWAPTICEAAQTVISFPQTLTDWWETGKSKAEEWATSISEAWTEAKDWAKNDEIEDSDNDPPEIKEIDIGALDTSTFKGVPGCPAPIPISINIGTGGETEISYEPICQLADKWSFVAPLIGFLSGALILVGVGRKGEDGEI